MTDTRRDEKIARLIDEQGPAGYGLWWMVLEIIAGQMEKERSRKCSVRYPVAEWAAALSLRSCNVRRSLATIGATGLLQISEDDAGIEVSVPNLRKYRDEYSARKKISGQSRDSVGSKKQKTDTEAEADTELKTKAAAAARPGGDQPRAAAGFKLPDWIPGAEWEAFLVMRVRIRRPATQHAKLLLIKKLDRLREQGNAPVDVLNQSIEHSWQSVYPLESNGRRYVSRERQAVDTTIDSVRQVIAGN
jgi:hypothetical protein